MVYHDIKKTKVSIKSLSLPSEAPYKPEPTKKGNNKMIMRKTSPLMLLVAQALEKHIARMSPNVTANKNIFASWLYSPDGF